LMLKHPKIGTNYFLGIFLNLKILFSAFLQNDGFSPLGLTVTYAERYLSVKINSYYIDFLVYFYTNNMVGHILYNCQF
ncbi:MAG: hypothetical protein FWD40_11630, partial [Treponema sp.]|nr:hypothetical protein [Treponema sp.]